MPESFRDLPDASIEQDCFICLSFDTLAKNWRDLSESEKILALGKLWERKKEIISPDGKKIGYSLCKFVTVASIIIDVDERQIKKFLKQYLEKNHSSDSKQSENKNRNMDSAREGNKTVLLRPDQKQNRAKKPNIKRVVRKNINEPDAVILTRDAIRKINRAFARKDKLKRIAKSKKTFGG